MERSQTPESAAVLGSNNGGIWSRILLSAACWLGKMCIRDSVDAAEYEPGYQLKGIEVVKLEPYETKKVKLTLSPRDFAVIEEDGSCVAVPGIYEISAGGQQRCV